MVRRYFATASVAVLILSAAFAFMNLQGTYSGPPPILDPDFKLWVDGSNGPRLMVWNLELAKGISDNATIEKSVIQGRDAVEFGIYQSGAGSRLVYASISQTIDGQRLSALLNETIGIWIVKEPCHCDANPFNSTAAILAVEVDDGEHTISFLFSDELQASQTLLNHRIVFMPTPSGVWSLEEFNVGKQYAAAHWTTPDRLVFSVTFGAAGSAVGWHTAYLNKIINLKSDLQNPLPPLAANQVTSTSVSVWITRSD
jgi:hypothetical protein